MGSIGKFLTDDLLGVTQYPDVKHASAQYDEAYQRATQQAQNAQNLASGAFGEAKGYRDEAGGMYRDLGQMGMSERDAALSALNRVLGEYGTTAGIATPLSYRPTTSQSPRPDNRTPNDTPSYATQSYPEPDASAPYSPDLQGPVGTNVPKTYGEYSGQTPPPRDPYALTDPQQTQANQQIDDINREKQSAIDELRARYAQAGITDPRAMEAGMQQVAERYDSLAAGQKAKFAEGARANREQALAGLLDLFTNLSGRGTSTYAGGAAGISGVGGQAQNAGDTQSQQAASLLSQQMSGSGQKLAQTQQAANEYEAGFMALLGAMFPNAFVMPSRKKTPTAPTP